MANQRKCFSTRIVAWSFLVLTGILIPACGGGGSEVGSGTGSTPTVPQYPAKMLSWEPPVSYADGTPLNPATDLDSFEIYVNESGNFSDADEAMATIVAHDSQSNQTATSFNLANLGPYLSKGVVYHVSLRTVAKNSVSSGFSPSATFSF